MKQIKLIQVFLVYCLLAVIISCKGQTQTNQRKENASQPTTGEQAGNGFLAAGKSVAAETYGQIIKCGLRDKAGNLWFGTSWKGVYRYDGKTFTQFSEKDGLCSNLVNSIYEDVAGVLWFGTGNGVCRYDGKTFTNFPLAVVKTSNDFLPGQPLKAAAAKSVESIMQDKAGNMWFGIWAGPGNAGAIRYDGKTFTTFFPETPVQGIIQDNGGGIWLNNKRYDGKAFTDYSGRENAFKDQVVKSQLDKDGNIWFGVRQDGLYRYNGKTFTWYSAKNGFYDDRVTCMLMDKTGGLWIGSDMRFGTQKGHLVRYDGKSFTPFPQVYDLGMNSIWMAVEDQVGNIWFGGRGGKLCRYDGKAFIDFSGQLQ